MNIAQDLAYLRMAIPDLEDYLLSRELYWPIPAASGSLITPGLNQLTLGGVLLSRARVLAANKQSEVENIGLFDQIRQRWRSNWAKKAALEFRSRVDLWGKTLNDLLDRSGGIPSAYTAQVRIRVMLELLRGEASPDFLERYDWLLDHDNRLRAVAQPGEFIWEPELAGGFPAEVYWYLYVRLAK